MSGLKRRNHYVPRFLLNRFASRVKGDTRFVWQFSKDQSPIEVSTRDAAVGSFFYGDPANGVEDRLSEVERVQAQALDAVEKGDAPEHHARALRHLIWTLAVRTRALRDQYADAMTVLLDSIQSSARDPAANRALVAMADRQFDQTIADQIAKLPPEMQPRARVILDTPEVRASVRAQLLRAINDLDVEAFIGWLRSQAKGQFNIDGSVADGHVRGIAKLLDRDDAPSGFRPPHWLVVRRPIGTFVLGDCCVWAAGPNSQGSAVLGLGDKLHAVYLPISSRAVLVASFRPIESPPSDADINAASVSYGYHVFFASRRTDDEAALVPSLGTGTPLLSAVEIAEIARDGWVRLERGEGETAGR
jgi:hypothetical protein